MLKTSVVCIIFIYGLGEHLFAHPRDLFSLREKKELVRMKSDQYLVQNFEEHIRKQSRRRLELFIANASKAHKDFLLKEVSSAPWKKLNQNDHNRMMNKLMNLEMKKIKMK